MIIGRKEEFKELRKKYKLTGKPDTKLAQYNKDAFDKEKKKPESRGKSNEEIRNIIDSRLRKYHYEYDDKNKLLRDRPKHDWSSHAADAFIYSLIAEAEQIEVQQQVRFKVYTPPAFSGEQTTGF